MTNKLTQPLSKRFLLALLVITMGVEIVLYLSRYSYLASTIYDAIMVASFFIGLKLHQRLSPSVSKPKRQTWLQLTGGFLIFFLGSTIINVYSSTVFENYSIEYDQYVQDYTAIPAFGYEEDSDIGWTIMDEIDTVGYDLFSDVLAGLEEVWRLGYIVLLLLVCKRLFPRRWGEGSRDIFVMTALFFTSILFGIDHTLSTEASWSYQIGSAVTTANMGLILGLILLWTRNLWVTVAIHSLYDIFVTISWYYFEFAVEAFAVAVLLVHLTLLYFEKRKKIIYEIESEELANETRLP